MAKDRIKRDSGAESSEQPGSAHLLSEAYTERTRQLYEARGALAEAVATLRAELNQRNEETTAHRAEAVALRKTLDAAELRSQTLDNERQALDTDNRGLYAEIERLNQVVSDLQNTKVMRCTAGARRAVHRVRARLR